MSPPKMLLVLCWLAACGRQIVEFQGGDGVHDAAAQDASESAAPRVIATAPVNNAIGIPRDIAIAATFSKAMNPTTLDALSFTVKQGATPISGAVALDGTSNTATFIPATPLAISLVYTATITTAAKDTGGTSLAADHVWHFTTNANVNANAPAVIFTSPANLATNVSVSKRPRATFSKAMNPATFTALTYTVADGVTPVLGTVSYDALTNSAIFAPTSSLALGRTYTATITTGAKDTGDQGLTASYTWSFTTGACSQAAIDLGSAGNFAVLGGSTVTNTGPTAVTGDLGVSPGTEVTGFPPGTVVGTQHAGDATAAIAIADLTAAYNDAAGRALCAVSITGNLGGMTLTPGLYKSTSGLAVSAGDLTLDAQGDSDAVFIFEMATTLTTSSGLRVILTNGATSANIYWQVGTSAILGTNSALSGTIMADQAITLTTGATLDGRALARIAAVNLDTNMVAKPAP